MQRDGLSVCIVGGGWYGCHIALELHRHGHSVSLFEKESQLFRGISGNFGIRLHRGPHYPRSRVTRQTCQESFNKFCSYYPELIIPHEQAIYAHGKVDAMGNASKVSKEVFRDVCYETEGCTTLDPESVGLRDVTSAYNLDEPSLVVGDRLRRAFEQRLSRTSVKVHLNSEVRKIESATPTTTRVRVHDTEHYFDVVINATAYASLIPTDILQSLPLDIGITYQSTIGVVYEDRFPQEKPSGWIILDGAFPCIMPMVNTHAAKQKEYLVIHGCYTILGSFDRFEDARALLYRLNDSLMEEKVRPHINCELEWYCPGYHDQFSYCGWKGCIIPKLKTTSELRSSLVFENERIIYVFPGKINNVITASEEAISLINNLIDRRRGTSSSSLTNKICELNGVCFTSRSSLATATEDLKNKTAPGDAHTSTLQTFSNI